MNKINVTVVPGTDDYLEALNLNPEAGHELEEKMNSLIVKAAKSRTGEAPMNLEQFLKGILEELSQEQLILVVTRTITDYAEQLLIDSAKNAVLSGKDLDTPMTDLDLE